VAADYSKFKTPFFNIKVGDSKGKPEKMVNLPHHILRLISKVEIVETFEEGQFNTINITFIEGSREPASQDSSLGTKGLYKISNGVDNSGGADMDVAGSLTNRTGIIADLRFSGNSGITFITKQEQKKSAIDTTLQKNVNSQNTTRAYPREDSKPYLLFQERNQIQVTWGYKEDPSTVRDIRAYILTINVKYPDSGQVETTIVAHDTGSSLDQLALNKGVAFGTRINTPAGNSITNFEDVITEEMIRDIANKSGIPSIISKNLPYPTMDDGKQKIWLAGESFFQFMTRLAKERSCVFKVAPHPKTGIDTLYFISKKDFEKDVLIPKSFLTYKGPNSILKSAEITVDFAGLQGESKVGYDLDGENQKLDVQSGGNQVVMFESNNKVIDNNPASNFNPITSVEGLIEFANNYNKLDLQSKPESGQIKYSAAKCEVTPLGNVKNKEDLATAGAEDSSRQIQLNFKTLGYTQLTPGTAELDGLGVRYSGKYRILTCTHSITSSGYETDCKALSMALTSGGILDPSADLEKDQPIQKVDVKLVKGKEEDSSVGRAARKSYMGK